jgi:hypothetical protein
MISGDNGFGNSAPENVMVRRHEAGVDWKRDWHTVSGLFIFEESRDSLQPAQQ